MSVLRLKKIKEYIINLDEQLGSGAFGRVYKGLHQTNKQECAIKVIPKRNINGNDYLLKSLMQEIEILRMLNSPNIVSMKDVLESSNNYYIVQQLCDQDLQNFLRKNKPLTEVHAITVLSEIANGFTKLVKEGIIHRYCLHLLSDLKPANILLKDGHVKIGDFGFSKNNICQKMKIESIIGSPLYKSPQILKGQQYSSKCDVWAFALIFYQMLHKRTPWNGESEIGLLNNIQKQPLVIDQKLSQHTKDFLKKTLQYEERDRLSWDEVFSHPIFQGMFEYLLKDKQEIEDKLKMLMTALRQEITRKNIDIRLLLSILKLQDQLTLPQFSKFIQSLCKNFTTHEIRYIFDKLDTDSSGTVEVSEIQQEMLKNSIKLEKNRHLLRANTVELSAEQTPKQLMHRVFKEMREAIIKTGISLSKFFYTLSKNQQSMDFNIFRKMMNRFGVNDPLILQTLFTEIDQDDSGTIEYEQLKLMFCHVNRVPIEALEQELS